MLEFLVILVGYFRFETLPKLFELIDYDIIILLLVLVDSTFYYCVVVFSTVL